MLRERGGKTCMTMKLIVGLGNPGRRYSDTRHNMGWRVAEELARRAGLDAWKEKFDAMVAEYRAGDEPVALARPLVYMNRSGRSVRQAMDFWKLDPRDLLVVADDLNLLLGCLRLRTQGSAGGHNGLASIVACLGHESFPRLRVGIGPAPAQEFHQDFVLSPLGAEEQALGREMIARAADAAECWIAEGIDEAMNRFNRPEQED